MDLRHKGVNRRLLSPALWGNIPFENWALGLDGYFVLDDFRASMNVSADAADHHPYDTYIDTGVTIKNNEDQYGVLEVAGNDADNDEGIIQAGGTGAEVIIEDGDPRIVVFEARFKKASIADNALAFFCGLGAPGFAAANALVDNTGAVKDDDFIGFHVQHDAGEILTFTYKANGQTVQVPLTSLATLVADTYVKAGFILKPSAPPSRRLQVCLNNVIQTTYVTQAMIEAATFPKDVALQRTLATKVGAAAESKFQIDWWALGTEDAD